MIGFGNLNNLINLCGARDRFATMNFANTQGGQMSYTADMLAKAMNAKKITGDKNVEIKFLISDSRRIAPSSAFFVVKGANVDAHKFVEEAVHRGAVVIISENPAPEKFFLATWIEVENMQIATAKAAKSFYDNPDENLNVYAITGTNGKTSVSWILQHILNSVNEKCGLIGTIHYDLGGRCLPANRTTPEALELNAMLNQIRYANCKHLAIEVSSHAINQKRVEGLNIDCACFLNLTQDHMDYHNDMEEYYKVKASIFEGSLGKIPNFSIINIDDTYGQKLAKDLPSQTKLISFSIDKDSATLYTKNLQMHPDYSTFTLITPEGEYEVNLKLSGRYNISNALTALSVIYAKGISMEQAIKTLANFRGVPGRMQRISLQTNFDVFVDYAHTDDALNNGLSMLKEIVKGRLLVVFGCGGKRDRSKRKKMTSVVQKYADISWATSDNPRGESLNQIFSDMKEGVLYPEKIAFIEDRRRAISMAIDAASKGDCILIAGKGHETFQELGDTIIPFDDKKVAEELINLKQLI